MEGTRVEVKGTRIKVDTTIRGYLTAFLDLLGVSNKLEALDKGVVNGIVADDVADQFAYTLFALDHFRKTGLVKAHRLESTVAKVPRVVIDPALFADFRPPTLGPDAPVEQRYAASIWEDTLTYLSRDEDENIFVDFLNPRVVATNGASEAADMTTRRVAVIDRHMAENLQPPVGDESPEQQKVRAKWEWLDTYWKKNRALVLARQGAGKETP